MSEFKVAVTGGGWVAANGCGTLRDGVTPSFLSGPIRVPGRKEIFARPLPRYGRFDQYTKLGCTGVALALGDAGLDSGSVDRSAGIVSSSVWDSLAVDLGYGETMSEEGGSLASPNLFSYTLPGTMHGECAGYFGLTGPTVCVGESGGRGIVALVTALRLLASGAASIMIAGWLDDPPLSLQKSNPDSQAVSGALFVVLEKDPREVPGPVLWISYDRGRARLESKASVESLLDIFGSRDVARS